MRQLLVALVLTIFGIGVQPFVTNGDVGVALLLIAFLGAGLLVVTSPQVRARHPEWRLRFERSDAAGAPMRPQTFEPRTLIGSVEAVGLQELGRPEPALSIDVRLTNMSPFELGIQSVTGFIFVLGHRCNLTPTLERAVVLRANGADAERVIVRQAVSTALAAEVRAELAKDVGTTRIDLSNMAFVVRARLSDKHQQELSLPFVVRDFAIIGPLRSEAAAAQMRKQDTTFSTSTLFDAHGRRPGESPALSRLRLLRRVGIHFIQNRRLFQAPGGGVPGDQAQWPREDFDTWEKMVLEVEGDTSGAEIEWDRFKVLGNMKHPNIVAEKIDRLDELIKKLSP